MVTNEEIVATYQTPATKHLQKQIDQLRLRDDAMRTALEATCGEISRLRASVYPQTCAKHTA